jgi:lipopolysaccharide/colanic/teichoic acid biosynthesis glycosyltransferase
MLLILPLALALAPILVIWIKLASPGPCIFRQTRIGRGGRTFTMYKFRTMHPEAATDIHDAHVTRLIKTNQPMVKLDDEDSRLIKGARFIRMSCLDELPQVLNVLRGEMSAVGPRPCVPSEFQFYDEYHFRRFAVPPGMTGIWQIKRTRFTTFREMMAIDVEYVNRLSPWGDLKIIMNTPVVLLGRLAACTAAKIRKSVDWKTARTSAGMSRRPF